MSTARWGTKWADVDEDDEEEEAANDQTKKSGARFETPPDKDGVKTVIEYTERDGKTYKVTKRVKVTTVKKWTNDRIIERKSMEKFGKAKGSDAASDRMLIARSEDDVAIELARHGPVTAVKDDVEDKFLEESLQITENLFKEKKVWSDMNKAKKDDEALGVGLDSPAAGPAAAGPTPAAAAAAGAGPSKYVPPSLRGKGGDAGGKGGKDYSQEASLRITNLSEDVKEGDLQDLFAQFGRLQRVYIAKDMTTYQCKGFAFVTYYNRDEAQRAINKLHGHGYDNLILQVQWAKPKE